MGSYLDEWRDVKDLMGSYLDEWRDGKDLMGSYLDEWRDVKDLKDSYLDEWRDVKDPHLFWGSNVEIFSFSADDDWNISSVEVSWLPVHN